MKKTLKRIMSILLSCLMLTAAASFTFSVSAENYTYSGSVVYLSDSGIDTNDGKTADKPVKTLARAVTLGGLGCTVVVTDRYTYNSSSSGAVPKCTLAGLNSDSVIDISTWNMNLGGDVIAKNITFNSLSAWQFILCRGNSFTAEENVKLTAKDGVSTTLGIRGGGEGKGFDSDTNVVLKSGKWHAVYGGTTKADISGNTYVTLYDTASMKVYSGGNDQANDTNGVKGNSVLKLVGSRANIETLKNPKDVFGTRYIDLTEYTGEVNAKWEQDGYTLIKNEADIPEFIKQHNIELSGDYDLSGIENPVFLSDSGDDANDGKSKGKPKKTLNAAIDVLGEKGGTVVITGKYTHNGSKVPAAPISITSSNKNDAFVWSSWALYTNTAKIYNLHIVVNKDYSFFLHGGTPLVIGENVSMENAAGVKYGLGIRAGEKGDFPLTDITIESGYIRAVYAGGKNGNINGDAKITISGGTVDSVQCGNDSTAGKVLGNIDVVIKGTPVIDLVRDKKQYDGFASVDISEFTGTKAPTIDAALTVIREKGERIVPINANAVYINGYPDGTFVPDRVMTRAEAITVVSKLCGLSEVSMVAEKSQFTDLEDTSWYARNVKYLERLGIVGFFGTELEADSGITRAEFVKLISETYVKKDTEAPVFSDVPADHKYYSEITEAAKAGLVTGYPDGTFMPERTLTRAEIVTVLNRLSKRNIVEKNISKSAGFSDIAGHWAASQIIAASSAANAEDGSIAWYSGDKYSENTPFDMAQLKTPLVDAVLADVDVKDANAVNAAVENYAEKRRQEIRSTSTGVEVTGTKYYVSNDGDDKCDGKTPETAWKTLEAVNKAALSSGDGVFFRRGDTFRGQLKTQKGVTYSAYGEGAKPNLYGSLRNYSESAFWDRTDKENVYVSKEAFDKDVGLIVFNHGEQWSDKQIDGKKDFNGTLDADLELYHSTSDKKLYLYSVSDPNTRWSSTEIAQGQHGICGNGYGVTIDNLCVKYVGAHGVGYGDGTTGLTVQNCEFGWIGGMIQKPADGTRYGNAVEIYVTAVDYTVDNCYIYEVYDAGVTHQYYQTRDKFVNMENIRYTNNVIEKCTYNIEYINLQPEGKGIMKDVVISGNLLLYGGQGWGAQRPSRGDAVIMGGANVNYSENYQITDNVIHTMDKNCDLVRLGVERLASVPVVAGNLFVGKAGNRFGVYGSKSSAKQIYDEGLVNRTIGLENNIMVFVK